MARKITLKQDIPCRRCGSLIPKGVACTVLSGVGLICDLCLKQSKVFRTQNTGRNPVWCSRCSREIPPMGVFYRVNVIDVYC